MLDGIIVPIIVVVISLFIIKQLKKRENLFSKYLIPRNIISLLILWTTIGFFTHDDFTESCGCLVFGRHFMSLDYAIYSITSLILLSLALIPIKNLRLVLIIIETIYWIFKLFYLKSGYIGGLGITIFKIYDFLGLSLRLWIILITINIRFTFYIIPIISGLIIYLKLVFFPCQSNLLYENYLKPYYIEKLLGKLDGEWTGKLNYQEIDIQHIPVNTTNIHDLILKTDTIATRDTLVWKEIKGINLVFKDSILIINKLTDNLSGRFILKNIQPGNGYLSYLPIKYSNIDLTDFKNDSIWQHTINLQIIDLSDTQMKCDINMDFIMILKKKNRR